jgi:hypothetical protein
MIRLSRPFAMLLALSACASVGASGREQEALASELSGLEAGPAADCIDQSPATSLQVVDGETLVYRTGRTIWVNRLAAACPGLRPFDTLVIEAEGSRYCRGDRFRAASAGSAILGPFCRFDRFIPYRRR